MYKSGASGFSPASGKTELEGSTPNSAANAAAAASPAMTGRFESPRDVGAAGDGGRSPGLWSRLSTRSKRGAAGGGLGIGGVGEQGLGQGVVHELPGDEVGGGRGGSANRLSELPEMREGAR